MYRRLLANDWMIRRNNISTALALPRESSGECSSLKKLTERILALCVKMKCTTTSPRFPPDAELLAQKMIALVQANAK